MNFFIVVLLILLTGCNVETAKVESDVNTSSPVTDQNSSTQIPSDTQEDNNTETSDTQGVVSSDTNTTQQSGDEVQGELPPPIPDDLFGS